MQPLRRLYPQHIPRGFGRRERTRMHKVVTVKLKKRFYKARFAGIKRRFVGGYDGVDPGIPYAARNVAGPFA